jgi:rRNA pseudouridine-1189 N-methylase Emg1 (Nep1/Mra1 family)
MKIRAAGESSQTLMKVVKNPIESHLPTGCVKYCTSTKGTLVDVHQLVDALPEVKNHTELSPSLYLRAAG